MFSTTTQLVSTRPAQIIQPQRTPFQLELGRLIEASGRSQKELAEAIGVDKGQLNHWFKGRNTPTPIWQPAILGLEVELGVEPYSLWGLVELKSRWGHPKHGRYEGIDDNRQIRREVVRMLTAEQMNLPKEEFLAAYAAARTRLTERRDPLMTAVTRSSPIAKPPEYPQRVLDDLARIETLSTMSNWHVREVMLPLKQRKASGVKMVMKHLHRVMRFASGDPGGPRMPCADLTLGLFLFPEIPRGTVAAKQDRLDEIADRLYLSKEDISLFNSCRELIEPRAGYVFQSREKILRELRPLDGYITRANLAELKRDWEGACRRAVEIYESFVTSFGQFTATSSQLPAWSTRRSPWKKSSTTPTRSASWRLSTSGWRRCSGRWSRGPPAGSPTPATRSWRGSRPTPVSATTRSTSSMSRSSPNALKAGS